MLKEDKRPTIWDVASAAGVSIGSVSNVFNGSRPVSPALQRKVLDAANTLGYQVNSVAQTLRRRRSRVIGLCTTHVTTVYLRELASALDAIATKNGYDLIQVLTGQEPKLELHRVRSLLSRQVDSLILLPSLQPQATLEAIYRSNTPAVIIDRLCEDNRFSYVTVDNHGAMQAVVKSLVAFGHRRLLFVAQNLNVITTRHRLAGLEEMACASEGVIRYEAIERGSDEAAYVQRLRVILIQPDTPTAIVMGNSSVALWTLKALHQIGIAVSDRIALVAFDDPEWATVLSPPLTTVQIPTEEIAKHVWALLEGQIDGTVQTPQSITVKAEVAQRASSMSPAPDIRRQRPWDG